MIDNWIDDRYHLTELLDQGGTSLVFYAEDEETGDEVVIKILSPALAERPEYAEAFKKEAQVLSRLHHESIVRLLSTGDKGKLKYFTMERIEGETLKKALQEDSLSIAQKVKIAEKICGALDYAHRMGVVHKDLKPANILLKDDLDPVLLDFGISEAPAISKEEGKEIFGTVQYFSPEQARGEKVDKSTDIYSLGVILYEMMTGELPFFGEDSVSIALKHLHQVPVAPAKKNPQMPESLNRIILKSLQKEKGRRYHTMAALQKDLSRCLEEPDGAYVTEYKERKKRRFFKSRPRRYGFAILAGIVGALLLSFAVFVVLNTLGVLKGDSSGKVFVPSLTDKTLEEAEAILKGLDLTVAYSYQASGVTGEGYVISQSPEMGSFLDRGKTVSLVVSAGAELDKTVPSLKGMGEEDALRMLNDMGFINTLVTYVENTGLDDRIVVSQNPTAGEKFSTDNTVYLTVNRLGDGEVRNIPALVGKSIETALDEAADNGFGNVILTLSDTDSTPGIVLSQFPTTDMTESDFDTLYLTIQEPQGNYSVSGTLQYEGQFTEESVLVATIAFEVEGRHYEFIIAEGVFENSGEYATIYPSGLAYKAKVGNLSEDKGYTLRVYLNYEVVYTDYVP